MERKIVQGKEYVFEKIQVEDKMITIAGVVSSSNSEMVEFATKRPIELKPNNGQMSVLCSVDEFMEELKFMCNYLNKTSLDDDNFVNAFLALCEKHIDEINRLIDTDLYSYIDKALILQNSIYVSYGSQLSNEAAEKTWDTLLKISMNKFKYHIFITKYDMSNAFSPKPYLVKLSELSQIERKNEENNIDYSTIWMQNICDTLNEATLEAPREKGGGKWKPENFSNIVEFIKEHITFDKGIYDYLNDKGLINTGRCPITGQSIDKTHFYQIFGRKVYLSEKGKAIAKEIDRKDHIKTFGKEPMSSERKAELRQEIIQKQGNNILSKLVIGAILLFILFKACS
jgi:hypothetical protein